MSEDLSVYGTFFIRAKEKLNETDSKLPFKKTDESLQLGHELAVRHVGGFVRLWENFLSV